MAGSGNVTYQMPTLHPSIIQYFYIWHLFATLDLIYAYFVYREVPKDCLRLSLDVLILGGSRERERELENDVKPWMMDPLVIPLMISSFEPN